MGNLKKDIEEAVNKISEVNKLVYAEYDFRYGDGSGNTEYDVEKLHQLRKKALKYHTTQIINLIESVIPEKVDQFPNKYNEDEMTGWNHCISVIKSKLIGKG